jgi:broad specificity phosphatase PhoE
MIIRHAEKPNEEGPVRGVMAGGGHNRHDLTVRGWQRAGALVRYFAPLSGVCHDPLISTPRVIIAAAAVTGSLSLRSQHTVEPLAALLALPIDERHPEGDEASVALVALSAPSPVLIAWHHRRIPALVDAVTDAQVSHPRRWPDSRFDVVWVLDRAGPEHPWTFSQTAQQVLPFDRSDVI